MSAKGDALKILLGPSGFRQKEIAALQTLIAALADERIALGSSGLPFGQQHILSASSEVVTISVIGDLYKISVFDDGIVSGMSFLGAASGSREGFLISEDGTYLLSVSGYFTGASGTVCNIVPHVDDSPYGLGVVFRNAVTSAGNPPLSLGGSALLQLSAGEEVSLYASNVNNTNDITIGDMTFSLAKVS